jgi:WD40 repeat protein
VTARWEQFKNLAFEALQLRPDARSRFLAAACADDDALRAEIEALLAADAEVRGDFLESPPAGIHEQNLQRKFGIEARKAGDVIAQRYRLIRELGEGGMGQVWLAEQTTPVQRTVALKFIRAGMYDDTVVRRFASERQSLAIMDHPAIAKVFDAGATEQGQPYFIMEYVPGPSITDYCDQHKMRVRERLKLLIQACEGVQHAHQKAVMHRDLKPANLLVVEVDGKPVPKIIDFGLAKPASPRDSDDARRAQYSQFFGTPGYISPEQLDPAAGDIDTRTDVYSLGVILYILVAGQKPFESKEKPPLDEMLRQLREEDPVSPSGKLLGDRESARQAAAARGTQPKALIRELRGDLDSIAAKALERDRERRYATPSELAADLRRYLAHEVVLARPASAAYQVRRFIRRHRVTTAGAALVALLAIVAFASAVVAVRQKHVAEYHAQQATQAQARLLTQAAAQRLKDADLAGAQGIILEVLTNPAFAQSQTSAAIGVYQDIRAADPQLAVLSGHEGRVHFAQYSPDGKHIVTASEDRTVRIWSADTGVQETVLAIQGAAYSAVYSYDGSRLVTASSDAIVRIWDVASGMQIAALSAPGFRPIRAGFSPDGMRVIAASLDRTARIFDARSGTQIAVLSGHEGALQSADYSPDASQIVTASLDKTARIWAAGTGALVRVLSGHDGMVLGAAYSPDGARVVTASADKTARIWDARTGAQLLVLSGHLDRVYDAGYSPDGTRIVSASDDGTARIWDARTGASLAVLSGHGGFVRGVNFSPDGSRVVTASNDKTARLWFVREEAQIMSLTGHLGGVAFAAYSRAGDRIITGSLDRTARIWDAVTGAPIAKLAGFGFNDFPITVAYSRDDTRIIMGGFADNTARIWDAANGAPIAALSGHRAVVESAVYSPDGARIATASLDKTARVWDARTGTQLALLAGHDGPVLSAAFSPDGRHLTTASFDKTARIWDAATGRQQSVLSGHSQLVSDSAYSPDGTRLVTASFDKTARIWDPKTGESLLVLSGHAGPVQSASYSPDGAHIVTSSLDKTARIWDAHTGAQLAVLSGHQDALQFAAYSPDGKHIVTASLDKTARIWDSRVPADLDAQIRWYEAADTDPLSDLDRGALGLPPAAGVRTWSSQLSACDRAAAAVYDPDRRAPGSSPEEMVVDVAVAACAAEIKVPGHAPRVDYQMGRALAVKGDTSGARRQFEAAVTQGCRAAQIDLGDSLANPGVQGFDLARAKSLYERAWQEGVPIAAFRLATLYEHGPPRGSGTASAPFQTDKSKAWEWYRKGADIAEPNSLARFAERDERAALDMNDPSERNKQLLRAFSGYAAAAMHAYRENWPDSAWRHWRYRRATLARVLAAEGLMQPAADAFAGTLTP